MTGNGVGDEGAKSMSEMLMTNKTLTSVYLSGEEEGKTEKEKRKK